MIGDLMDAFREWRTAIWQGRARHALQKRDHWRNSIGQPVSRNTWVWIAWILVIAVAVTVLAVWL